jgi:hypothetical protein
MTLYLEEDESFTLTANVESTGYQGIALQGYLVDRRSDGTYIAPLIPQLFFGVNGTQLQTWRQNLTTTGSQVILSRSGGYPKVPKEELYWRKVEEPEKPEEKAEAVKVVALQVPSWVLPVALIGGLLLVGLVIYKS